MENLQALPHDPETFLRSVSAFSDHLVLWERHNGLPRVRIISLSDRSIELVFRSNL